MHRLTEITLDHPKTAATILLLITVGLAAGLPRIPIEHGSRVLVGESHPVFQDLDEVVDRFSGGLPIEVGWACGPGRPCSDALGTRSLGLADAITRALSATSNVRRVYSSTNTSILVPASDGFAVRRLVEDGAVVEDYRQLADLVVNDKMWVGRLISRDLAVGAIIVQPTDATNETGKALLGRIDRALAPHRSEGFVFWLNGKPVRDFQAGEDLQTSTNRIIPALVAVIAAVLWLMGTPLRQVGVALITMGIALVWTQGLMGWLRWPQDGLHQVLAPLIMIVGVCDAVHLLTRASQVPGEPGERLRNAAISVGNPCAMTTATSAVAFASFTTSGLFVFVRFGVLSAFGVLACLLLTFSLLPLLALLVPGDEVGDQPSSSTRWTTNVQSLVAASTRRASTVIALAVVIFVVGGYGWIAHLRVDTDWLEAWGENSSITQAIRFFSEARGASDTVEVQLVLPTGTAFDEPSNLEIVALLGTNLEQLPSLFDSRSVVDLLGQVNSAVGGPTQPGRAFAPTQSGNAELLELLGFDDPELLSPWLTIDHQSARLSVDAELRPQREAQDLAALIRAEIHDAVPNDWDVTLTGSVIADAAWVPEILSTQLRSFPTAFVLVLLLSTAYFRSLKLGLAAMIPTLLPIVLTLGTMGWAGLGLDIGRAMIAAIVIGIGVDDAIHFLDAYQDERLSGANPRESAEQALHHVGRALITTSLALSFGFLTLMVSTWQTISTFGFFVSITVMAALISTLFLLPVLLLGPWNRSRDDVSRTR